MHRHVRDLNVHPQLQWPGTCAHLAEGIQADPVFNEEAPYFLDQLGLPQGYAHSHAALGLLREGKGRGPVGGGAGAEPAAPSQQPVEEAEGEPDLLVPLAAPHWMALASGSLIVNQGPHAHLFSLTFPHSGHTGLSAVPPNAKFVLKTSAPADLWLPGSYPTLPGSMQFLLKCHFADQRPLFTPYSPLRSLTSLPPITPTCCISASLSVSCSTRRL